MIVIVLAAALASAAPAADRCPELITPEALICRAIQAQAAGNEEVAAQSFDEAANASPDSDPGRARLFAAAGNMWLAAGQPGKAAVDLDKALAMPGLVAEQHGEALLDRARAAEAQGDYKTARAKADEAAATISDDPFYWYFSAALAIREGDHSRATASIGKALTLAPSDPAVLLEAGYVADFNGDEDSARSYWRRAAEADPNGPAGKAAAKAAEMAGVTPAVKAEATPPKPEAKPAQPRS